MFHRWGRRHQWRQRLAIQTGGQNRLHTLITIDFQPHGTGAGRLHPLPTILAAQADHAQRGAISHLRMGLFSQHPLHQTSGKGPRLAGPLDHPCGRPLQELLMRLGAMFGNGGAGMGLAAACMAGQQRSSRLPGVPDAARCPDCAPSPVQLAEPAIVVTFRMGQMVFFPQQLQGDILAALQLLVDDCKIRQRTTPRRRWRRRREYPMFQGGIIEIGGQRPPGVVARASAKADGGQPAHGDRGARHGFHLPGFKTDDAKAARSGLRQRSRKSVADRFMMAARPATRRRRSVMMDLRPGGVVALTSVHRHRRHRMAARNTPRHRAL